MLRVYSRISVDTIGGPNIAFDIINTPTATAAELTPTALRTASTALLAQWLRCNRRYASNTEMNGGNAASCIRYVCQQVKFIAGDADSTRPLVASHVARLAD